MENKYDNVNRGVLFRDEKRTNERAPEYTGTINVAGKDFRLSAWVKESKAGKKFLSLAVSIPQAPKKEEAPVEPLETTLLEGEEIPF